MVVQASRTKEYSYSKSCFQQSWLKRDVLMPTALLVPCEVCWFSPV